MQQKWGKMLLLLVLTLMVMPLLLEILKHRGFPPYYNTFLSLGDGDVDCVLGFADGYIATFINTAGAQATPSFEVTEVVYLGETFLSPNAYDVNADGKKVKLPLSFLQQQKYKIKKSPLDLSLLFRADRHCYWHWLGNFAVLRGRWCWRIL